jgi:Flp pilus assembly protein TadG
MFHIALAGIAGTATGRQRSLGSLWRDEGGVIAVITGLLLLILIGFIGLAIDTAVWYRTQRALQNAADSAAVAAALNGSSTYQAEAKAVSARYGFTDGAAGITVTALDNQTCPNGQTDCYSVTIADAAPPQFFSQVLHVAAPALSGSAMAMVIQSGGACVLALNPSASGAVTMNGNVSVALNCGIAINSNSSSALLMNGNNSLTATFANIVGNILRNPAGGNTLSIPHINTGAAPTADPYANISVPSFSGCTYPGGQTINGSGSHTLQPGIYCGNITINGNPTVTLSPGTYILDQGSFIINGSPTVTGDGVAIVLTSSTGNNIGSFIDNGTPLLNLTAESAGFGGSYPLPGFVVYQDRRAPAGGNNTFNGTNNSVIQGALYFPSQNLTYNGTPTTGPGCTEIVAQEITFNGTPDLYNDTCSSQFGLAPIGGPTAKLVH